ncbi:MAG: 16S rRNA (uracil(1498)-N(3))-methyltransferase [Thiotrichales bacterium]|nr:16S rRNA (uracil(1498)-N(3))-methyltransferase [Thiotrichales bacterium]
MRIPRLYLPADYAIGAELPLEREQAHYVLTVLRLKNQHRLQLFDGQGQQAEAILHSHGRREASIQITHVSWAQNESPLNTILLQGISRGDRMDYSIQKAVELGVSAIQPLFTERCEVKLEGDKLEKRRSQWQSIAISACEQSSRAKVPTLLPLLTFNDFFSQETPLAGVVCDPYAQLGLQQLAAPNLSQPWHLLVGPEGGLSEAEVTLAVSRGLNAVQLGPRILRTETAGPAMLAIAQALWGDWQ